MEEMHSSAWTKVYNEAVRKVRLHCTRGPLDDAKVKAQFDHLKRLVLKGLRPDLE